MNVIEKHFIADTVVQVFTRMNLIAKIYAALVEHIQNRQPSICEVLEASFSQAGGSLRPWIHSMPQQSSAESSMSIQSQVLRCLCSILQLLNRPVSPRLSVAPHIFRSKSVKQGVICRVHCHQLSL